MTNIDYYLSLNSPWTYLGSARLLELREKHGVQVTVKPTKFADVFAQTGGLPLLKRSPQRQAYRMMELKRWRDQLGIPIILEPKHFPSDETLGYRLVIAADITRQDAVLLSAEIGRALWEEDKDFSDWEVLKEIAKRVNIDADMVRAAVPDDDELDAIVAKNAEDAVSRGVFGAPSYVFEDGEIIWGQDRMDFIARKLASMA